VTGTDANGCTATASVSVTVNPLPVVNAGPDENICPNNAAVLNVTGPPAGSTYGWTPSSSLSCSNCADPTASPQTTTTYVVLVTTPDGCSATDTVNVIVTPLVPLAGPDTTICSGSFVPLYASGGTSYLWSPGTGLDDPTSQNPVALPINNITYTVTISSGACIATATVAISTFPAIPTPNIAKSGDTLICSQDPSYVSYQWYFDNNIIPNSTTPVYVATQSGNYNVAVTDINGCSISVGINISLHVGLPSVSGLSGISVSPNPATDKLFLSGVPDNSYLVLFNALGKKVREIKKHHNSSNSVDVSSLAAGIYFIRVEFGQSRWTAKFVKE
jgi:hypothetical protein